MCYLTNPISTAAFASLGSRYPPPEWEMSHFSKVLSFKKYLFLLGTYLATNLEVYP